MKLEIREIQIDDLKRFLAACNAGDALETIADETSLHPQALIAGAYVDDKIAGVCCCQREDRPEQNHLGVYRIVTLFVDPELRGHGLARLLLLRATAYTKRFKGRYIWCKADSSLAIFLRKCGFSLELPAIPPADAMAIFVRDTSSF